MRHVVVIFIALFLSSCAADSNSNRPQYSGSLKIVNIYPDFRAHMASCTETHGFDPLTASVDENALAPGEIPWRACVYQGINEYIVSYSQVPELYEQIMAQDRVMTEQIAQGALTRTARRSRLDEMIGNIRMAELNRRDIMVNQAYELQDFVRRQQELDDIARMHRQASEVTRLLQFTRMP